MKGRYCAVLLTALCQGFFSFSYTEEVDITGVVKNRSTGEPLQGALVRLLNHSEIVDTTDEDGFFHLRTEELSTASFSVRKTASPSVALRSGGHIELNFPFEEQIRLDLITVQGRRCATIFRGRIGEGKTVLNLPGISPGFYFLSLNYSGASYSVPFVYNGTHKVGGHSLRRYSGPQKQASSFSFPDTIAVTLSGFFISHLEVSDREASDQIIELVAYEDQSDMVLIEASDERFAMGSAAGATRERPLFTVTFTSDFYISGTPVTQNQYLSVMEYNPSLFNSDPNNPVEMVTWFDAALYCNELSKREGLDTIYIYTEKIMTEGNCTGLTGLTINYYGVVGYRLPTEAEWEYSCRGGTTTETFWGDENLRRYVWYSENSRSRTHPVGHKLPNQYGLYDLIGNVSEWCNDWYGPYTEDAKTEPIGPLFPTTSPARVARGNSWKSPEGEMRSAYRNFLIPSNRDNSLGFRVVLTTQ